MKCPEVMQETSLAGISSKDMERLKPWAAGRGPVGGLAEGKSPGPGGPQWGAG